MKHTPGSWNFKLVKDKCAALPYIVNRAAIRQAESAISKAEELKS